MPHFFTFGMITCIWCFQCVVFADQFECAFVTGFRDNTSRIFHIYAIHYNWKRRFWSYITIICTFQSSQFFDRLSMHFGVVDHIRTSALTTADRRPPSWNWITDSTNATPVENVGCRTPLGMWASDRPWTTVFHFFIYSI
jgi:hypothetical protein